MGLGFAFAATVPNIEAPTIEVMLSQLEFDAPAPTEAQTQTASVETSEDAAESEVDRFRAEIESIRSGLQQMNREMFITSAQAPTELDEWMKRWRQRVEMIGNQRAKEYGLAALNGDVLLVVSIKSSGEVNSARILSSSGDAALDRVAQEIAVTSGPFDPLPDELRRQTDVLHITRTWRFGPGGANISR